MVCTEFLLKDVVAYDMKDKFVEVEVKISMVDFHKDKQKATIFKTVAFFVFNCLRKPQIIPTMQLPVRALLLQKQEPERIFWIFSEAKGSESLPDIHHGGFQNPRQPFRRVLLPL